MEALTQKEQKRYEMLRAKAESEELKGRQAVEYQKLNNKITEWGNKNTVAEE